MLRLDHLHRAESPLESRLRGKLRWVAADAIGCEYGRRYAAADLRRTGLAEDEIKRLSAKSATPPEEQSALALARQLTLAAYKVTDEDVEALLEQFGPEQVVAMVHTIAYANFQDRILLALAAKVEDEVPLPPLKHPFELKGISENLAPPRAEWKASVAIACQQDERPQWTARNIAEVSQAVQLQKSRRPRIPLPAPSRLAGLPEDVRARTRRIIWSSISMGYSPRLTTAWFDAMVAFQEEAQLNRVFSNTIFWVVTRTNDCYY
jgi:hypothetical protein